MTQLSQLCHTPDKNQIIVEAKGFGFKKWLWTICGSTRYDLKGISETISKCEQVPYKERLIELLNKKIIHHNELAKMGGLFTRVHIDEIPVVTTPGQVLPSMSAKFDSTICSEFASIHSNTLSPIALANGKDLSRIRDPRTEVFLKADAATVLPPVVMKSECVPDALTAHIIEDKVNLGIQNKSKELKWQASPITNVEAIYAQLQVQLVKAQAVGDINYHGNYSRFEKDMGRQVVVSTHIHPDYERSDDAGKVMALLTQITDTPKQGTLLSGGYQKLSKTASQSERTTHDNKLLENLVYHLTIDHKLPNLSELKPENILTLLQAMSAITDLIQQKDISPENIRAQLKDKFVRVDDKTHSLEVLFAHYVYQLRNEFSGLEALLPQGYVYTIDPPAIFAQGFNATLMTRLQILGLKYLSKTMPLSHMQMIGFNDGGDNGDKAATELLQHIFGAKAVSKVPGIYELDLVTNKPKYKIEQPWALVIHNNSDAFGQNIEFETGFGSLDAAVGALTTAVVSLRRDHPKRTHYCYTPMT